MERLQVQKKGTQFKVLKTIGGSDANNLVLGTLAEWRKIVDDKIFGETVDLSHVLPVQMGIVTEELNRKWFTKTTGLSVTTHEDIFFNDKKPHAHARVDGTINNEIIFEAKHTNPFKPIADQVAKYYGQLQHYMMVLNYDLAYLSIFVGNMNHHIFKIQKDKSYINDLEIVEKYLYDCIDSCNLPEPKFYDWFQNRKNTKLNIKEITDEIS